MISAAYPPLPTHVTVHAYAVVETASLPARRLAPEGMTLLFDGILPAIEVVVIDSSLHREAVAAYRASGSSQAIRVPA